MYPRLPALACARRAQAGPYADGVGREQTQNYAELRGTKHRRPATLIFTCKTFYAIKIRL